MKCVIPSQNVKIISRAIHSLAKIGDEMFIEPTEDDLLFRTVNMAQSAFAEFRMCRSFFSTFIFNEGEDKELKCKITMKSCISVFKSMHNIDKQVENCEIRLKSGGAVIIFQIKFSNSSLKKYFLPIIDSETVEASFGKNDANVLLAPSKFLSSCLKHFRQSEDEITLTVTEEKLLIKNHLELNRDCNLMRTELSFAPSEFEQYTVSNPTRITFCLKEFRAVLMFAEPANLPVSMSFTGPGSPIVLQVLNHPAYEANYVVSTLNLREMSGNFSIRSNTSGENRIQQPLSGESISESRGETPNRSRADPFSFQSELQELPRHLLKANSNYYKLAPSLTASNIESRMISNIPEQSNSNAESRNEPQNETQRVHSEESVSSPSEENELPSHVSHLVKTVFARCFRKINTLDLLPGHDVVVAQETQNILEGDVSLRVKNRHYRNNN